MPAFGLDLDSPLLPNVDAFINPMKDEDAHRGALNAVVSAITFSMHSGILYCVLYHRSML